MSYYEGDSRFFDLYIFERWQDAEHFNRRAKKYARAITPAGLLERVRGMELRDVVVEPYVKLTPHAREVLRSRQRSPSSYIVEPETMSAFTDAVAAVTRETKAP